jgi:F-type H+-transporting ATPase subunit a
MPPAISNGVHISLRAEPIFHIGNFPVTNTVFLAALAVLLLTVISVSLRKRLALVPGRVQNAVEMVLEGILGVMDTVLVKREKSEKYLPLIATIFFFVITSNWLGLLPGVGSLGLREGEELVPLLRSPASDLNFTLALALITVFTVNFIGIAVLGAKAHLSKYLNFKGPIEFFIGMLELISEFAKIISFSFRLFGNVFAGEVLLVIIASLVPFVVPLPFLFLEIFVGFIQAFIFSMLALVFVAIATTEHEGTH